MSQSSTVIGPTATGNQRNYARPVPPTQNTHCVNNTVLSSGYNRENNDIKSINIDNSSNSDNNNNNNNNHNHHNHHHQYYNTYRNNNHTGIHLNKKNMHANNNNNDNATKMTTTTTAVSAPINTSMEEYDQKLTRYRAQLQESEQNIGELKKFYAAQEQSSSFDDEDLHTLQQVIQYEEQNLSTNYEYLETYTEKLQKLKSILDERKQIVSQFDETLKKFPHLFQTYLDKQLTIEKMYHKRKQDVDRAIRLSTEEGDRMTEFIHRHNAALEQQTQKYNHHRVSPPDTQNGYIPRVEQHYSRR